MNPFKLFLCGLTTLFSSGSSGMTRKTRPRFSKGAFEVHAHRGNPKVFPENTVEGSISAVCEGVDAIEMDVVVSKDRKVVVSHEAYMAAGKVLTPEGSPISKSEESSYNLFQMDYSLIREFKCVLKNKPVSSHKPLLSEVIARIKEYTASEGLTVPIFNIEIKSEPEAYGISQPPPEEFSELVLQVLQEHHLEDRVIIQSFDPNILNLVHDKNRQLRISFLIEDEGIEKNLSLLKFTPSIYSPHFQLIRSRSFIKILHSLGMQVIPWTVNREKEIIRMVKLGADGIITDYPKKALHLLRTR